MTEELAKEAAALIARLDNLKDVRSRIRHEYNKNKDVKPVADIAVQLCDLAERITTEQIHKL